MNHQKIISAIAAIVLFFIVPALIFTVSVNSNYTPTAAGEQFTLIPANDGEYYFIEMRDRKLSLFSETHPEYIIVDVSAPNQYGQLTVKVKQRK